MNIADQIFRDFLREIHILGWPEDKYGDSLDLENLLLIEVSSVGIEFCCGGDWQDPQRLLLAPNLTVISVDGPTNFGEIEVNVNSLSGLEKWLEDKRPIPMDIDKKTTLIIETIDALCQDDYAADGEILRLLDRILEHIDAWYESIEEG